MSDINILSPHVADLIAAGEVVERPASVIKELIENSFDAGAQNITVEIKGGGMTYIRVTDDGCGMLPEDAGLCFLRHATSKLRDERGLECIGTMGFRGEALAAISSVARVELITRKKGTNEGTRVTLDAGEIIDMSPVGCPEGTTMIIRDLFFNTPARLKFMKTDRSEGSACSATALRCALGRPEVSVRFLKDGNEEFFSPGDGKISSCIYTLLGREISNDLLECSSSDEGISVSGFVGSPKSGHGNRGKQFFFCNGRCIKSQLLQAAVEQAYKNTLLTGRYPACVVYLKLSPAAVDVNVHPAKTEVKFREERRAFDAIYYAALSALNGERTSVEIKLSPSTKAAIEPKKDFFKSMNSEEFHKKFSASARTDIPSSSLHPVEKAKSNSFIQGKNRQDISELPKLHSFEIPYKTEYSSGSASEISIEVPEYTQKRTENDSVIVLEPPDKGSESEDTLVKAVEPKNEFSIQPSLSETIQDFRLVGEAMKTYIIVEKGSELILIDKHAAHERMIFDRLKKQGHEIMSQSLLVPITIKLSADEIELIEKNSEKLEKLGFEIEPYGTESVIMRSVPADTDTSDAVPMVEEICEKLRKSVSLGESAALDEILHTIACKAAIKAGYNTTQAELSEIAKEVVSGRVKYCPHGRPVSITLTKKQLDKEFSRIV